MNQPSDLRPARHEKHRGNPEPLGQQQEGRWEEDLAAEANSSNEARQVGVAAFVAMFRSFVWKARRMRRG